MMDPSSPPHGDAILHGVPHVGLNEIIDERVTLLTMNNLNEAVSHLATKHDLIATKNELKNEFKRLEDKVDAGFAKLEAKVDAGFAKVEAMIKTIAKHMNIPLDTSNDT